MKLYHRKQTKYADLNELIEVYDCTHGDVWLYENERGVKFPCHKRYLGDKPVEVEPELPKARKQLERRKAFTQAEKLQMEYLNLKS